MNSETYKKLKVLNEFAIEGRRLLDEPDPIEAHKDFNYWVDDVANFFKDNFPGLGLTADWSSLGNSIIITSEGYDTSTYTWLHFTKIVENRLVWLAKIPPLFLSKKKSNKKETEDIEYNNKIFIVHGHNNETKETVARFIEKLDLETVILHEQPNIGKTIIEKFEKYSRVGYAIILLTGDDLGGVKSEDKSTFKLRARQNVILELGYFIGLLGRQRVCALLEKEVEIPSDYDCILFVRLDDSANWKMEVLRELKAVGYNIDINKIL